MIADNVRPVVYHLTLPRWLTGLHPTFYVGLLKRHQVGGDGRLLEGPRPVMIDGSKE